MSTQTKNSDRFSLIASRLGAGLLTAVVVSGSILPVSVEAQASNQSSTDDVSMMSMGDGTTCAVTVDGRAKCWGINDQGQLGRGDTQTIGDDERLSDVPFIDLGGTAVAVHTNGRQTFALLDDGTVRAWGANGAYELGLQHAETIGDDETPGNANLPVDVLLSEPAVQIAVGDDFACALLSSSGTVQCWGANDVGQLGYGHTWRVGDDESPGSAGTVALGGRAVSVVAGAHHACASLDDGSVRCWGLNDSGQLGYGHTQDIGDDELPTSVPPVALGGTVVQLVAGERHTCARFDTGAVRCWGGNDAGQLGYAHSQAIGDNEIPTSAPELSIGGPATTLAAGARHTCAVVTGGELRCWGEGIDGQLGYGNHDDVGDDEPITEAGSVDLGPQWVDAVYSGPTASSTAVRLDDNSVKCWGLGDVGQLGLGDTASAGNTQTTTPIRLPYVIKVDDTTDDD